ncbi:MULTISPECIES: hypothetical protein [unclassified Brenneria]|nr:hypothetical protein [Brenneria sp. L3-3C-1]MEE3643652.1 hypothetical protein [Brenneria sp. L3_3C_1]
MSRHTSSGMRSDAIIAIQHAACAINTTVKPIEINIAAFQTVQ